MFHSIFTIMELAAIFSAGMVIGSKRKNTNSLSSDTPSKNTKSPFKKRVRMQNPNKDAIDIMDEFCEFGFDDFQLISTEKKQTKYQYLENDFLFTVIRKPSEFSYLTIQKGGQTLLDYQYSHVYSVYRKKEMVRSLIDGHPREAAMDSVTNFVKEVFFRVEWNHLTSDLIIKDDIKTIKPHEFNVTNKQQEDSELLEISSNIEDKSKVNDNIIQLQSIIHKNVANLNADILNIFDSIITNMQISMLHIDKLELIKRHSVEDLIQKDLEKLLLSYKELNDSNKEAMHDKVLQALHIMNNELKDILHSFEKENIMKVEQIVKVIESRDY